MNKKDKKFFNNLLIFFINAMFLFSLSIHKQITVYAEEHSHTGYTIWGDDQQEKNSLPTESGKYYLCSDIELNATWVVPEGETHLCLNGKVVSGNSVPDNDRNYPVIELHTNSTLYLEDCGDDEHYFVTVENDGWDYKPEQNSKTDSNMLVTGGVITSKNVYRGGGIENTGGTLIINGGNIVGNYSSMGGAGVFNNGTFIMNNGNIEGNFTYNGGGGVENRSTGDHGLSTFIMNGGTIKNNSANTRGGGVEVSGYYSIPHPETSTNSIFTMNGGTISGNSTNLYNGYYGGGVCVNGDHGFGGIFNMNGGIILNNISYEGAGIANFFETHLNSEDGQINIENNTANNYGGGVYNDSEKLYLGKNVVIKNNDCLLDGEENLATSKPVNIVSELTNTEVNLSKFNISNDVKKRVSGVITNGYGLNNIDTDFDKYLKVNKTIYTTLLEDDELVSYFNIDNGSLIVDKETNHGYIEIDKQYASLNEEVVVNVYPDEGYVLCKAFYLDSNGKEHYIKENNGSYSFNMPNDHITVSALFDLPHIHDDMTFTPWGDPDSLPTEEGNYVLYSNVLVEGWTVPTGQVNLCLNGYFIDVLSDTINVNDGSTLDIYDCNKINEYKFVEIDYRYVKDQSSEEPIFTHVGGYITESTGTFPIVTINEGGECHVHNGGFIGCHYDAAFDVAGKLILDDGEIRGNYDCGVIVTENAIFEMYGGHISNNFNCGVCNLGKMILNDGEISRNGTDYGGGILNYGELIMNDGIIKENIANCGGGVYGDYRSYFEMNGGTISDNIAEIGGAGVFVQERAEFVMNDGLITNNVANTTMYNDAEGGGVYVAAFASFVAQGGVISGNTADYGGGVYLSPDYNDPLYCITEGTAVLMKDGSHKNIEELKIGDEIKVFNHDTGELDNSKIFYLERSKDVEEGVITLNFSNNVKVSIVTGHSFYSREDNKYVVISTDNVDSFIGKHFYNAEDDRWEELLSYTAVEDPIDSYSIVTYKTLNAITNKMLSCGDSFYYVLVNTFDFEDPIGNEYSLKVNATKKASEIDDYGLVEFDVDNFMFATPETFDALNLEYLNILIEKGKITYEQVMAAGEYQASRGSTLVNLFGISLGGDIKIVDNNANYLANDILIWNYSPTIIRMNKENTEKCIKAPESGLKVGVDVVEFDGEYNVILSPYGLAGTNMEEDDLQYFTNNSDDHILRFAKFEPIQESSNFIDAIVQFEKFDITNNQENKLSVSEFACPGDTVTISLVPNSGYIYTADSLKVNNGTITITKGANNTFTFTMPAEEVTIDATFTEKANNSINNLSIEDWTYGEFANSPTASSISGTIIYSYSVYGANEFTDKVPTDAGKYTLMAFVAETDTTKGAMATVDFNIKKKDIKVYIDDKESTYNESLVTLTATAEGIVTGDQVSDLFTLSTDADNTAAGNYYILATVNEGVSNYNIEFVGTILSGQENTGRSNYNVLKAVVNIPDADNTSFVYTGNELTYNLATSTLYTITGSTSKTNAGDSNITVSLNDKDNYEWSDSTITDLSFLFSVTKAIGSINVNTTTITKTYGESFVLPTATSNFGTVICNKTINELVNAGTYTVTYSLEGTDNYTGDSKTLIVTINKAKVTKPAEDNTEFKYTGKELTYNIANNNLYTVSNNKQTEKGTYEVVVSLNDTNNYEWNDGTTNDLTYTFTINKSTSTNLFYILLIILLLIILSIVIGQVIIHTCKKKDDKHTTKSKKKVVKKSKK